MTDKLYQIQQANWRGVPLTISYSLDCSPSYRAIYGRPLAHVKIQAPCPLPITPTGFLSHLMKPERIYGEGGPVTFITAWLEREVTPAWAKAWEKQRQLCLF